MGGFGTSTGVPEADELMQYIQDKMALIVILSLLVSVLSILTIVFGCVYMGKNAAKIGTSPVAYIVCFILFGMTLIGFLVITLVYNSKVKESGETVDKKLLIASVICYIAATVLAIVMMATILVPMVSMIMSLA